MFLTDKVTLSNKHAWAIFLFASVLLVHRLRVFESRVLRRIFGLKRDEVTGEWRKLHNEELN
jgi:hypothetical protein